MMQMPAISFAHELPESDIMQRPPRNPSKDKLVGNKYSIRSS